MISDLVKGEKIRALLVQAGLPEGYAICPIPAGGNNRVFKLTCENDDEFLLKEYFSDKADPRNRLQTEFSFLMFLWKYTIRSIAKPIISSPVDNIGLFRFIDGTPIVKEDITGDRIEELLSFFAEINHLRNRPEATELPNASDACFTLAEHIDHIQERINRLSMIQVHSDIDQQASEFVRDKIVPRWQGIVTHIQHESGEIEGIQTPLSQEMRVLSPSDFGFHNAILKKDDTLAYIDFEYAGWDDPVKTLCDLLCQPKIPIPLKYYNLVANSLFQVTGVDMKRCKMLGNLLFPAYQIKWCCIILNEFLPTGKNRRKFADLYQSTKSSKIEQLCKAHHLFESILCDHQV